MYSFEIYQHTSPVVQRIILCWDACLVRQLRRVSRDVIRIALLNQYQSQACSMFYSKQLEQLFQSYYCISLYCGSKILLWRCCRSPNLRDDSQVAFLKWIEWCVFLMEILASNLTRKQTRSNVSFWSEFFEVFTF